MPKSVDDLPLTESEDLEGNLSVEVLVLEQQPAMESSLKTS